MAILRSPAVLLSNQFKEHLAKIYELKPYVNLLDINEQMGLGMEEEANKLTERLKKVNLLIKHRNFGRSFHIPY